jgi:hypothetical protein
MARIRRKSVRERINQAQKNRHAERVRMARTLVDQRASMQPMDLSAAGWVSFRLGCSMQEAEELVAEASQAPQERA